MYHHSHPPTKRYLKNSLCFQAPLDSFFCNNEEPADTDVTLESDAVKDAFDIASYVTGSSTLVDSKPIVTPIVEKKHKFGGKKIDMKAQRYVIDDQEDDHIDVETVSENGSLPVLEAGDLDSLLEQFEASEEFQTAVHNETKAKIEKVDSSQLKTEPILEEKEIHIKDEVEDSIPGTENKIIASKKEYTKCIYSLFKVLFFIVEIFNQIQYYWLSFIFRDITLHLS